MHKIIFVLFILFIFANSADAYLLFDTSSGDDLIGILNTVFPVSVRLPVGIVLILFAFLIFISINKNASLLKKEEQAKPTEKISDNK